MKEHMAEKAKTRKTTNAAESSSEDYSESSDSEDD
jgi:hypothetical protein